MKNVNQYQYLISKFIYLTVTCLDIVYIVGLLVSLYISLERYIWWELCVFWPISKWGLSKGLVYKKYGHLRVEGYSHSHLFELGFLVDTPMNMYCDNQVVIFIAHNHIFHEFTKYIEVDCHYIRDLVMCGLISNFYTFLWSIWWMYLQKLYMKNLMILFVISWAYLTYIL